MPSVNMTDLDWFGRYSELMYAAYNAIDPHNPVIQSITVSVTFGAGETFSNFDVLVPFQVPSQLGNGPSTWDHTSGLELTQFDYISVPAAYPSGSWGFTISGHNPGGAMSVDFTISATFIALFFAHISSS